MKFKAFLIFLLILNLFINLIFCLDHEGIDSLWIINLSTVSIIFSILVFILSCQQNIIFKDEWIKPSNIFLFSLLIVNFQYVLDVFIGLKNVETSFLYPDLVADCALLSSVGITSFVISYVTLLNQGGIRNLIYKPRDNRAPLKYLSLIHCISFLLWIVNIDIQSFLSGAVYMGSHNRADTSNYFELLFNMTTYALLVQILVNNNSIRISKINDFIKLIPKFSLIVVCLYLLLRFFSGDRGPLIFTSMTFFYAFVKLSNIKIKLLPIFIAVFFFATSISVLGIIRNFDSNLSYSEKLSTALDAYMNDGRFEDSEQTLLPLTEELANSFSCNQIAVHELANGAPLHYGKYQLFHFLNSIPFVPSFLSRTLSIPGPELSSSTYLTEVKYGKDPPCGLGTTCIADFYLDLDVIGVMIGMVIVGFLFFKIDLIILNKINSSSVFLILFALVYSSKAVYIPRSAFFADVKILIIIYIILLINRYLFKKIKSSRI